jgi:hypothetical protein
MQYFIFALARTGVLLTSGRFVLELKTSHTTLNLLQVLQLHRTVSDLTNGIKLEIQIGLCISEALAYDTRYKLVSA